MAPQKTVIMVLKVDLQCSTCYKKVKKLLCKYPQITGQLFDEKANTVIITLVCCNPEKMRDKLRCKAGKAIKSIDIKDSPPTPKEPEKPKPKEPEKPKPQEPEKPKPKEPEKPKPKEPEKPKPKEPEKPKPKEPTTPAPEPGIVIIPYPVNGYPPPAHPDHATCCGKCYQGYGGGPCEQGFGRPMPPPPHPGPMTCCGECYQGYGGGPCQQGIGWPTPPPPCPIPVSCCGECYQGYGGGPCQQGFCRPVPPPRGPCYDGYGYGRNRVRYMTRSDYFSEGNSSACSIM